MAETFIPNPKKKPCVNHIDRNPLNYQLNNLEWVTYRENGAHKAVFKLWQLLVLKISQTRKSEVINPVFINELIKRYDLKPRKGAISDDPSRKYGLEVSPEILKLVA